MYVYIIYIGVYVGVMYKFDVFCGCCLNFKLKLYFNVTEASIKNMFFYLFFVVLFYFCYCVCFTKLYYRRVVCFVIIIIVYNNYVIVYFLNCFYI